MKQIMIELSENDYELACKYHDYELVCRYPDALIAIYTHAIKNGTLLPEHHGDLIDRTGLLDCSYEIDSMYCEYDEVVHIEDIKNAPTIIEGNDGK